MSNQIEKLFNAGQNGIGLATTDEPGIASFDENDFLVTSDGMVQALTKWGIAHILNYKSVNDVARMYTITASFGTQLPKIGDTGLVLSDETVVDSTLPGSKSQIGTIVRLTAVQIDGTPTVYYGEVLGSIRGPNGEQGVQGIPGQDGAIQNLVKNISTKYGTVLQNFGATGKAVVGDAALIVTGGDATCPDGSIVIITGFDNTNVTYSDPIGSIKGVPGAAYIPAVGNKYSPNDSVIYWTPVSSNNTLKVGDYAIATTTNDYTQRGDIYYIKSIFTDGKPLSSKTPTIPAAALQLGIYNLSDAVVNDNGIIFKYSSIGSTVPFVGALGLCIDDNDKDHFGRIYTIVSVSEADQTVTTALTGSSIIGPAMDIIVGNVTTVPNTSAGAAGQATATMTVVDALTKKLNLGIPAGPKGEQGIQGPAGPTGPAGVANVNAKGAYDSTETYVQNDLVYFDTQYTNESFGGSFICTVPSPGVTGSTPKDNPNDWGLFVAEGAQGPQGPVGPQGATGSTGQRGNDGIPQIVLKRTGETTAEYVSSVIPLDELESGMDYYVLWTNSYSSTNSEGYSNKSGDISLSALSINYGDVELMSPLTQYNKLITNIRGEKGEAIPSIVLNVTSQNDTNMQAMILYNINTTANAAELVNKEFIFLVAQAYGNTPTTVGDIIKGTIWMAASTTMVQINNVSILGSIRGPAGQPEVVTISTGSDGKYPTQGTFTRDDMTKLLDSTLNVISRDNELYTLMDNQHDSGYLIYSHIGHNSLNKFMVKCITITVNTRAWSLAEQPLNNNYITVTGVSFAAGSTFTLTQEQALRLKNDADCCIYLAEDDVIFKPMTASQYRNFVSYKVDGSSVDASILAFSTDSITTGGVTVQMIRKTYSCSLYLHSIAITNDANTVNIYFSYISTKSTIATLYNIKQHLSEYYNNFVFPATGRYDAKTVIRIAIINNNITIYTCEYGGSYGAVYESTAAISNYTVTDTVITIL